MKQHSVVYTLCFVGGCMDCISFLLLFHTLLGLMTFNTMYGVIGLLNPDSGIHIGFHLYLVGFFIIFVFLFKLIHERYRLRQGLSNYAYINLEAIIILVYACLGSYALRNQLLAADGWIAFSIACLGMIPVYLQNYVISHNHSLQTGTVLMTGNYVNMVGNLLALWSGKADKDALKHYMKVHVSFILGVAVMALASQWFDFLALLLPCALLALHNVCQQRQVNKLTG
ncbi:YoaK family protein [Yokenella regensburgei]|uniref:DUF1275 family protein n=1 Tax=Yokenella regensburgei TaxID=158877 RepID=UPI0027D9B5DD|nr:DUF1275 family protein [Yokenella regensburgei]MDQ4431975.1 YoaK family protein [Yokenella regensburgei]